MKKLTVVLVLFTVCAAFGQAGNGPTFLGSSFDTAGAVGLRWVSEPNLVYRIDYADTLLNSNTQWKTLYEDYPSHGTNTIYTDAGAGFTGLPIAHPNDGPKRFYRITVTGTNTGEQPLVTVLTPAGGSVLSDYIAVDVGVTSSWSIVSVRLFVDGQEAGYQLYPATNFILNTAQFSNGSHKIFAVAETMIGGEATLEAPNFTNNFTASPSTTVTFDNYISDFRGSARFLEPTNNEAIKFKANFAAYSDWTLTISNLSAVTVRTQSGSGHNMAFLWDGRDSGSNTVTADFYVATLSATLSTNVPPQGPPSTNPPPSPNSADQLSVEDMASSLTWFPTDVAGAIAGGWEYYYTPTPPLPPKLAEQLVLPPWIPVPVTRTLLAPITASMSSGRFEIANGGEALAGAAPPGGGTTTLIPPRIVSARGSFGVAYQGHHPSTGFGNGNRPSNGLLGRIQLNGNNNVTGAFGPLRAAPRIKIGFHVTLGQAGYRLMYEAPNDALVANDLRGPQYGGTNKFNSVNIGLLVGHGVYGSDSSAGIDYTVGGGTKLTYFPIYKRGVNSYDWVRFNEFKFGPSGSQLRWMGILSCNNMIGHCYDDMYDKGVLPIGNSLHLLLGSSTSVYIVSNFGMEYGAALTGSQGRTRMTVAEAWFYAGQASQGLQPSTPKKTVRFRVAGWPNCFSDDLSNFSSPDSGNPANITSDDRQVYP